MYTSAHAIYKSLIYNDVRAVFMYSGGAIMPLVNLFKQDNRYNKIKKYINNHEQNCGHAATGYAKSTGRTGTVIVTSGPGLTNMITPILDANNDSTPMVVFSGQVSKSMMGTSAFQECPATDITKSCTKWSYCANTGDDLFDLTNEAFKIANYGKKGVVHIDLPKCILTAKNGNSKKYKKDITYDNDNYNDNINYAILHNIICFSKKPVIYIGKGCNNYSNELKIFAEKYNIPVTSTIHSMGTFNENHKLSLGFLGMHGFPCANYAIQNSDLIIALGSRFDDRTTGNVDKYAPLCNNIIHVNISNEDIGKVIKSNNKRKVYNINIDCGKFLSKINSFKIYKNKNININRFNWFNQIKLWKKNFPITYNIPSGNKLNTQMFIECLNKHIDHENTIITSGVGNHQMMASQFINWTNPNQFITSGSLGVMGTGLPYAIGVKIGNRNKIVINIDGDGSFNHTLGDLQSLTRYNLPIKIFIMNDGHMSMVRAWEKLFFKENYVATECSYNPDYCLLAKSYGIKSVKINDINDINEKIKYVLNYEKPILCNVIVNSDLCLPLVAPGKALDEILFLNNNVNKLEGVAPS